MYGIIYKTTCLVNGKIYIGQTIHPERAHYLGSGKRILAAIKRYGRDNFVRETLIECKSKDELDSFEEIYIKRYKSTNLKIGYNVLTCSPDKKYKRKPATSRKSLSQSTIGRKSITNGKQDTWLYPGQPMPDGYRYGRKPYRVKRSKNRDRINYGTTTGKIWINDGVQNAMIGDDETIPEGWERGMAYKKRKR